MEYFITAIWSLIEIAGVFTFLAAFLPRRKNAKHHIFVILILWLIMYTYSALGLGSFTKQAVTLVLAFLWSLYLFSAPWYRHALCVALSYIFCAIIDVVVLYGASYILGISYTELAWQKLLYTVTGTLAKLLYLLLAYVVYHKQKPFNMQSIQNKWTLLTVAFPASSLLVIIILYYSHQKDGDLSIDALLISIILAVANILILYLIRIMERSSAKENELTLLQQQMNIQTESIAALEKSYRAQRASSHEFQHHIQTIHHLIERNEIETTLSYLSQLQEEHSVRVFCVNTKHPIIDAILNQKYQVATEQSIDVHVQVNDLSTLCIDMKLMVVLLSNLLDNAIEACIKMSQDRMIICSILLNNDDLFISIKNTSPPVQIVNGTVPTSKTSSRDHGYGLIAVTHILNQLNAEYVFQYEAGVFQFSTEIPLK